MLILTIHGLGGSSFSHNFMRNYLSYYTKGSTKDPLVVIESFDYDSRKDSFEDVIEKIENYLSLREYSSPDEKVILIGHSLGGIIATHINHPRVKCAITISSPHTNCYFARFARDYLHNKISDYIFGKMYERLVNEPEHSKIPQIICITSSWNPYYKFDGRVYTDEMVHPEAVKVFHLEWSDHILQLYDVRMMRLIYDAVVYATQN